MRRYLVRHFGGLELRIPKVEYEQRDERIRELYADLLPKLGHRLAVKQLAEDFELTVKRVRQIVEINRASISATAARARCTPSIEPGGCTEHAEDSVQRDSPQREEMPVSPDSWHSSLPGPHAGTCG